MSFGRAPSPVLTSVPSALNLIEIRLRAQGMSEPDLNTLVDCFLDVRPDKGGYCQQAFRARKGESYVSVAYQQGKGFALIPERARAEVRVWFQEGGERLFESGMMVWVGQDDIVQINKEVPFLFQDVAKDLDPFRIQHEMPSEIQWAIATIQDPQEPLQMAQWWPLMPKGSSTAAAAIYPSSHLGLCIKALNGSLVTVKPACRLKKNRVEMTITETEFAILRNGDEVQVGEEPPFVIYGLQENSRSFPFSYGHRKVGKVPGRLSSSLKLAFSEQFRGQWMDKIVYGVRVRVFYDEVEKKFMLSLPERKDLERAFRAFYDEREKHFIYGLIKNIDSSNQRATWIRFQGTSEQARNLKRGEPIILDGNNILQFGDNEPFII